MWTITYRGWYIHGYCDRKACRIQSRFDTSLNYPANSLGHAKRLINKKRKQLSSPVLTYGDLDDTAR